ncbi:MAG: efflux transporter outer membrane subunit, partial [Acidobacteriota bacterium]
VGGALETARERASESTPEGALATAGLTDLEMDRSSALLSASWEIDLFGGVRRAVEASDARVGGALEGRRGVQLALIAEVARSYVQLRGDQRRLALAEKNTALQGQTRRRVSDLARVGLGSNLDVSRASAQLAATRALAPPLRASIRAAGHRLGVLTGRSPSALLDRLLASSPAVDPPDLVPSGLPSDLLRRRPDVRAAERRLAAATAEIGVRTADLYPRFFLTGGGGLGSTRFADLFESGSRTFSIGPRVTWPIFQGGRIRAGIAAAEADRDIRWAEYRQAVLLAVEDVENALVAYAEEELRRRALAEAAAESARAVTLATVVYDKGLESFLTVLDAERSLVEVEDRLAASETAVVLRLVGVYAALGGGWEAAESVGNS